MSRDIQQTNTWDLPGLKCSYLEAFRLTLVKKNRQNGERRKMSGYLLEKAEP